jgi:hypothetical protein
MIRVLTIEEFNHIRARIQREDFLLLRNARDVIKGGPVKMWDAGPGVGCPVQDQFFRRSGLRIYSNGFVGAMRYGSVTPHE